MSKTILIADDNDDLRAMLSYQLQRRDYRVLVASDGQQAVQKAFQEKPDLILMDIIMAGVDGTEASVMLKADPRTSGIPIIFLTALIQGDESDKSMIGDGYIMPKSTEFSTLLNKIQEILAKGQ